MPSPLYTLEMCSCLNQAVGRNNPLVESVLDEVDKFIGRLTLGSFKPRPEAVARDHYAAIRTTLARLSGVQSRRLRVDFQSLQALGEMAPRDQLTIYEVAKAGSVGAIIIRLMTRCDQRLPWHAQPICYADDCALPKAGAMITLEDIVRRALITGGLPEILRDTRYGGLSPIIMSSIVLHFCQLLTLAGEKKARRLRDLMPLTKLFRTNTPIGHRPRTNIEPERWLVFCE